MICWDTLGMTISSDTITSCIHWLIHCNYNLIPLISYKIVSIQNLFWCSSMNACAEALSFPYIPYKVGNYNSAYTEKLLIRLAKISLVGKKKQQKTKPLHCNMKDSFNCGFMAGWVNWESSDAHYSLKRLREEEDLRHLKGCFCVSFGFLLRIIMGVKLREIHWQ